MMFISVRPLFLSSGRSRVERLCILVGVLIGTPEDITMDPFSKFGIG